jgi:subtilisin family serine protease
MRVLLIALLAAISYAQTERRNLAERRSAVRRRLVEHKGIDNDAAAKMAAAGGETSVDLVIVHDDLEVGDNARERCHNLSVEFCEAIGAHDDVHAVNCEPHEIAKDFTYVGPDVIAEDSTYYCGQYVYDVHPTEIDTLEAILDRIDGSDARLKISQNHHDYRFAQTSTCTDGNSDLWHLKAMNPSGMNNFRSNQGFDGEGTIAYIIDTGVNKDHVDFEGRVVGGWNIVDNNDDFSDIDGHGTHVAGSVAGRTTGVAPNALIWGVQVFYFPSPGEGPYTGDSLVGQALEKIVEKVTANGEKAVVNMSLGGRGQNTAYQQVIDAAIAAGVNIVVAAGNSDDDACDYSPAFVPSAITVGAYGQNWNGDYEWAYFSNYGQCVDISAPGMSITGPQHDDVNGFIQLQGTSMAAPHVAGVIATIMSRTGVSDPQTVKWMLLGGEYSADLSNLVQGIPDGTTPLFAMQPCIEQGEGDVPTGPPEGVPIVTTTTGAPVVTDFFTMAADSDCTVNGNCVTSANWPSAHGNNEGCSITVDADSSVAVNSNFEIERNYDYLRVNDAEKWTAAEIPTSMSAGTTISWSSDGSVTKTGWELCFSEAGSNPGTSPPEGTSDVPTSWPTANTFINTNTPLPTDNTNLPDPTDNMNTSNQPTMWPTMGNTFSFPTQHPTEGSNGVDRRGEECWNAGCWGNTGAICDWCGLHNGEPQICCNGRDDYTNNHPNCDGLVYTSNIGGHQCVVLSSGGDNGGATGVFSVSGSGCTVSDSCVSSKNYPSHYGNQQSCTVTMTQNVRLAVQSPFEIERSYDYLRINNAEKWTAGEIPSTLTSGSTISWSTDYSVTKDGWKICFSADDGSDNGDNGGDNSGTRTCNDVNSSVRSNDWQLWCMVSSGPLSAGTVISFSMNWNDQGWGYQKGRVALVEDIGEEDPLRHFQTDKAPHSRASHAESYTLAQDVDNLEFRFRVGGGGGHRITIQDFSYTVTEPDNGGGIFDVPMMTEAESLKMKKAKALKTRRMKQHQLEEQIRLDAEIAAREYSMVQEVIFNPLLIEVFAFIGAVSIVGAVVQKGLQYRNKGDYINIEQEI